MITITTNSLTEIAWIVMGVWGGVTLIQEALEMFVKYYEENNYWRERHKNISETLEETRKKYDEFRAKYDEQ